LRWKRDRNSFAIDKSSLTRGYSRDQHAHSIKQDQLRSSCDRDRIVLRAPALNVRIWLDSPHSSSPSPLSAPSSLQPQQSLRALLAATTPPTGAQRCRRTTCTSKARASKTWPQSCGNTSDCPKPTWARPPKTAPWPNWNRARSRSLPPGRSRSRTRQHRRRAPHQRPDRHPHQHRVPGGVRWRDQLEPRAPRKPWCTSRPDHQKPARRSPLADNGAG
jgi:hypothetical protein